LMSIAISSEECFFISSGFISASAVLFLDQ
jgi:hypothetical protein